MNKDNGPRATKATLLGLLLACAAGLLSGCNTFSFYRQAIGGEYHLLASQEPIGKVIADPLASEQLKRRLRLVRQLRGFAAGTLKLPADGHYQKYVDVHRPYVVWSVQAAPEFSLQPRTWWYPLVGSLEYRGYFSERGAQDYARRLRARGDDVSVNGVEAYSTLGWFKDPVLNTFVNREEPELAEVIFHELGHQRLFAPGDTDFNEAYATTVGQEGARRWLRWEGNTNAYAAYVVSLRRDNQFVHLVMKARRRLEALYGDTLDKEGKVKAARQLPADPRQLRAGKQRIFDQFRTEYAKLKLEWGGYSGFDDWFGTDLNNAQLNGIANYYDYLPAFEELLRINGGNMEAFYRAAEKIAKLPIDQRHQRLRGLARELADQAQPPRPSANEGLAGNKPRPRG